MNIMAQRSCNLVKTTTSFQNLAVSNAKRNRPGTRDDYRGRLDNNNVCLPNAVKYLQVPKEKTMKATHQGNFLYIAIAVFCFKAQTHVDLVLKNGAALIAIFSAKIEQLRAPGGLLFRLDMIPASCGHFHT